MLRENLSNWSSGVQIPCDICTHFGHYLYSMRCSWIIIIIIIIIIVVAIIIIIIIIIIITISLFEVKKM